MGKLKSQKVFDLEYFFEVAPDLLCVVGFDGYFKKINPAVCNVLGYTEDELFASPINDFIHHDDRERTAEKGAALLEGRSLLNFENRYVAKDGSVIWLSWTSVPIKRDNLVFAIAKDITYRRQLEEYERISSILGMINDDHHNRFKQHRPAVNRTFVAFKADDGQKMIEEPSQSDQFWLNSLETIVRQNAAKTELNLDLISDALAISQRQLFRRVHSILGITPNKLVRIIRLQLAWEAIASGKYRSVKEIASIAGYSSRGHFNRLFYEVYGIRVAELL
ncbi:PAS domain S-box-containing protein [Pedobacter sp. W3I1]|uniref:PAS domain S-box protein n=1 Tax=Pedobacter sp. W3I1 TaxID=3042291 RepID=UPI002788E115|nr:PAS domain S-box protein [Pedobacter sp. W3I1]MDQ0641204.1 PAS domain S-box-containing protein [Pedobacter sp. W3I1]